MNLPLANTDPEVEALVLAAAAAANAAGGAGTDGAERRSLLEAVPVPGTAEAVDYINYHTAPLVLVNFSDARVDGLELVQRLMADPWMSHAGLIAIYGDHETYLRIEALEHANIIIALGRAQLERQLPKVLGIIRDNQHVLYHRALHAELVSAISGHFELGVDLLLVPCYANLLANYVHNVGFVDVDGRKRIALVLTEMLNNAIEHGSCEIGAEEKAAWLDAGGSAQALIEEKARDPRLAGRRVFLQYNIDRQRSVFTIRDEGLGFDWRRFLGDDAAIEDLALHGRGILLTRESVGQVSYNEHGNEVRLAFEHHHPMRNAIPEALRHSEEVRVQPGDVVMQQGEQSTYLYYVAEGEYRVEVNGVHIANVSPDDVILGEMSFLLEERRSASVIARTPGRLIRISQEAFINIVKDQPYYALFLAKLLAQRLNRLSQGLSV